MTSLRLITVQKYMVESIDEQCIKILYGAELRLEHSSRDPVTSPGLEEINIAQVDF